MDANDVTKLVDAEWLKFEHATGGFREAERQYRIGVRAAFRKAMELVARPNLAASARDSLDAIAWKVSTLFPAEPQSGETLEAPVIRLLQRLWAKEHGLGLGTDAWAHAQVDVLAKFILNEIPGEPSQNEGAVDTAIRLLRSYAHRVRALNAEESAHHQYVDGHMQSVRTSLAKYFPNVNQPNLTVAGQVERALQLGREGIDGHQKVLRQMDEIAAAVVAYLPFGKYTEDALVETVKRVFRFDTNNRQTIRKYLADEGLPVPESDTPVDALLELAMNRKRTIETYERSGTFMQVEAANERAWKAYENGFKDGQRREEERQRLMTEQAAASEVVKAHAHVDSNEPVAAPRPPSASKELMVQLTTDEDALIQANNQLERAKQAVEQARARREKTLAEVAGRLEA